ncbi:EexN family lipoprotein [Escherichia coli]|nr:EexN family lipoprotein [Escherichia coli]
MNKTFISVIIMASALSTGCKDEEKSYAWYSDHPDETYDVYTECLESGEASLNCDGARRAAIKFAHEEGYRNEEGRFTNIFKNKK